MKKLSAAFCLLLLLSGLAHAAFGTFQTYAPGVSGPVNMGGGPNLLERSVFASNTPTLAYSQWYVPGNGSPAISTSDYYLMNGFYWSRPYDLDTMGADGAAIKAREGYRYVWIMCGDHTSVIENFAGASDLFVAYSNDPQILPEPTTMRSLYAFANAVSVVDQNGYTQNTFYPYQIPHLEYNPDPGAFAPFYIYMEGVSTSSARQHELTLLITTDFLTATIQGPAIPTTSFSGWSSYGRPVRLGVNNWEVYALGKIDGSAVTVGSYRYTSTDGWAWTPDYSQQTAWVGSVVTISGQRWLLGKELGLVNDYLSMFSIDSVGVYTGTTTRISTGFGPSAQGFAAGTAFPGPTYFQDLDAHSEDGVTTIYVTRGFFASGHDGTIAGPYRDNSPSFYLINGDITSNVLTVNSIVTGGSVPPLSVGMRVGPQRVAITSFGTGSGGVGTYNVSGPNVATQDMTVQTNGGLWHQFVDLYYLITDIAAASSAAPMGVRGSCAAGTATIQWNNSLPHQNYRVYKGTTAGTQATLVGNVTGTSITDTPTANAQTWYKVVTMNVTEQKSRVINVYCSANTAMVNKHVNRVLNDGGTFNNLASDITFIASADSWLTTNNAYRYLQWWTDVRFGYKLNGSGFIAKIYDLGTTQLPRGGDYTPTTSNTFPSTSSNTSYSSNSFRGTTPSWVNNANTAHGYFGNGRINNFQRWNEITMLAAYQKPGTAVASFFGSGEFNGIYLQHESGSPGSITFGLTPNPSVNTYQTATVAATTPTAAHVAAGTLDSSGNIKAYFDGTPGSAVNDSSFINPNMTNNTILRGNVAGFSGNTQLLAGGSPTATKKASLAIGNSALYTGAGQAVFNKDIGQALIQSWGALYN